MMTTRLLMRTRRIRSLCLLAVAPLLGAGCRDNVSPTAPEAVQAVVADPAAAKTTRTPFIEDLQLHYIYVDIGPDGTYDNGYDVTITNPGPKTTGLYLQNELQGGQYTVDGGGTIIFCPALDGVLQHGTCKMTFGINPPPVYFPLGPARFTLKLVQRGADNSIKVLDSRTVDVVIVHS
jgi:hypothetical protein